jgi:hypothetical protein
MVEVNVLQSMHGCGVFDNLEGLTQPQSVEDVTDSHIEKFLEKSCNSDIRDLPQSEGCHCNESNTLGFTRS